MEMCGGSSHSALHVDECCLPLVMRIHSSHGHLDMVLLLQQWNDALLVTELALRDRNVFGYSSAYDEPQFGKQ